MYPRKTIYLLSLISLFCYSVNAAESLSYSGRLVNANGSPVTGSVDLKVELAYSGSPGAPICSQDFTSVPLTNGVFHLKVDFNCGLKSLAEVFAEIPNNEAASIRVTDISHSKVYSYQALHAVPFSNISDYAKQLVLQGTSNGQVLTWNNTGKKWEVGSIPTDGTVTNVSVNSPLSISNPATTPSISISQANSTTDGYISNSDWNTFNNKQPLITAGTTAQYYRGDKSWQTLDTSAVAENIANLYFTNARALGVPLSGFSVGAGAITAADTILSAFEKTQGQINSVNSASAHFLTKDNTDSITGTVNVGVTGALTITNAPALPTDATNKQYVDSKLALTGGTISGVITIDSDLKIKGGSNYVTVLGHATSSAYNFILPQTAGTSGHVLQTDGVGNLSWINPSSITAGTGTVNSASIVDGSIVDADVNASAAIAQSKIANLTTDLAGKEPSIAAAATTKYFRGDKTFVTLDTSVVPESGNLYFTNARVHTAPLTGFVAGSDLAIVATDTNLQALEKTQGQINNRVKKNGDSMSGDLSLDTKLRFKDSSSNYIDVKAPTSVTAYTLTLPATKAASSGQVLTGDTSGNLTWTTPSSSATPSGAASGDLSGTYPAPTISALSAAKISSGVVDNTEFNYLDGVNNPIQSQINGKQASDTTLTSLANYNANGILVQIAADTFTGRSVVGTNNRVTVTNGNGVGGDPTINIDTSLLPSPTGSGQWLKSTGANTSAWTNLASSDVTTALGFTPINKTSDTISSGTFIFNGTAILRTLDPVGANDVATKQYVDNNNLWTVSGSDINRSSGKVGIGTATPQSKLDVAGSIRVGTDATACSATIAGSMRFTSPNVEYCNGSNWIAFANTSTGSITSTLINDGTIVDADVSASANIAQSKIANLTTDLAGKEPAIATGSAAQYVKGNKTLGTFANDVLAAVLSGLSTATNAVITASDNVLSAFGKLQKQITDLDSTKMNKTGGTLTVGTINGVPTPVNADDIVNKGYVDAFGQWIKNGINIYFNTGNVGIGTSTPDAKLTVNGTIKTTAGGVTYPDGQTQVKAVNLADHLCPSGYYLRGFDSSGVKVCEPVDQINTEVVYTQVSVNYIGSCAIRLDNIVECWGYNSSGQVGDGFTTTTYKPVVVRKLDGTALRASKITSGAYFNCAIQVSDSKVYCWGYNDYGQLGTGNTTNSSFARAVNGLGAVIDVGAGGMSTCVVDTANKVWCWGYNVNGELGDGTNTGRLAPTATLVGAVQLDGVNKIVPSAYSYCAYNSTSGTTVYCWGYNGYGQIGDNTVVAKNKATPVNLASYDATATQIYNMSKGGSRWASYEQTCAVIKTNTNTYKAYCWGRNAESQLLDGTTTQRNIPTYASTIGVKTSPFTISAFLFATCLLESNGVVSCMGHNNYGQLGNGTTTSYVYSTMKNYDNSGTLDVASLPQNAGGYYDGTYGALVHFCVLTTTGRVACSGYNGYGNLGNGNTSYSTLPVAVLR